jgi:hypothetical protein
VFYRFFNRAFEWQAKVPNEFCTKGEIMVNFSESGVVWQFSHSSLVLFGSSLRNQGHAESF